MTLWAISDLHLSYEANREALTELEPRLGDHLILGGDLCESPRDLAWCLSVLSDRFERLYWVPGNHELWSLADQGPRGVAKYEVLVEVCRQLGVLTPEDPWASWPGDDTVIALLFLLYDYSFAPEGLDPAGAVAWARADGIVCRDERLLHPDPYPSREAWCAARLAATRARLAALPPGTRTVLVNHFPLRRDLVRLRRIPRFSPWCGTRQTEDWHLRYGARVVVSGHLHMRATDWRDGVRFEEVALGYPAHWRRRRGVGAYLRQVLPEPGLRPPSGHGGPVWHR